MKRLDFEAVYLGAVNRAERDLRALIDGLPAIASATADGELAETVRAKLAESTDALARLGKIGDRATADPEARSDAIDCILASVATTARSLDKGLLRDVALIAAIQHVQHHQIATFGTLAAYAKALGRHDDKRVFGAILEEERAIDGDLSMIAAGLIEPLVELATA